MRLFGSLIRLLLSQEFFHSLIISDVVYLFLLVGRAIMTRVEDAEGITSYSLIFFFSVALSFLKSFYLLSVLGSISAIRIILSVRILIK
jgi:hypothetical protein